MIAAAPTTRTHRPPEQQPAGFRGDIEGMRAVAVLLVVAFHAGLPFVPGGYVGVDVFFVLSGFLIKHATEPGTGRRRIATPRAAGSCGSVWAPLRFDHRVAATATGAMTRPAAPPSIAASGVHEVRVRGGQRGPADPGPRAGTPPEVHLGGVSGSSRGATVPWAATSPPPPHRTPEDTP